ncbi:Terminase large subunit, Lambdalikevirus-type [uncultured Caudovirales phage]|uniref:Terminase large subunit, Lambdalikevirus-type n=1 Tax=uncultured Caudovirales phage TaxID=2100421 RepID=A0A6J5QNK9_9CAUD|nr:Terminase large subunit, Lambdalikevirus-type [uncultured Caudovirales phage]CAB4194168.1 Terminase large subunit, Lambdalikevirus-type [uncultured Caudovirales phage]CAB4217063.1 Terminase large subunit, Lambdalikevirus-type [uncultured Caudovirales phage]
MSDKPKRKQPLRGATKPRIHSPLLKEKTGKGMEIKELADKIKVPLLPWQEFVLNDMMKTDKAGNFIRKSNLCLVARQNGKTHLARMRVIWGLFYGGERNHLIMSSNRGMALSSFRDIAYTIDSNDFLKSQVKAIRYANGTESIELLNGARLDVVAATRDGSRGRTADFLWIDELREINEEGFRAATPVTRARPNAQSLFTSNAGDAFSTVLNDMRERALSYPPKSFGFYEYSAPQYCKIEDRNAWALANPALGYTVSEEAIEEAIATSPIENTRTETLCQWIDSLSSPWPHGILEETSDSTLELSPGAYTIFGFDVSPSRRNSSLVAGQLMPDGRIGIGILQTWENAVAVDDLQIAAGIKSWCDIYKPRLVCYDKYATQSIADRLGNSGVMVEDVSGQQFYQACGDLLNGLVTHKVVHNGQAEFIQQMNNCAAKVNDSAWRIVKRKSAGDISAPIGLAMVVSKLMLPVPKPQIYVEEG